MSWTDVLIKWTCHLLHRALLPAEGSEKGLAGGPAFFRAFQQAVTPWSSSRREVPKQSVLLEPAGPQAPPDTHGPHVAQVPKDIPPSLACPGWQGEDGLRRCGKRRHKEALLAAGAAPQIDAAHGLPAPPFLLMALGIRDSRMLTYFSQSAFSRTPLGTGGTDPVARHSHRSCAILEPFALRQSLTSGPGLLVWGDRPTDSEQ